jgi:hypothetical protein
MGEHEAIDLRLPALRPLPVVLSNHIGAVAENVRYFFERGAFPE